MRIYESVLEMIGNTPMYKVRHLETGLCELYLKLELANPAGSVKDRIGLSMIEEAELRGDIKPGDTLVEATAGNTGLGLALVAAQKGYQLVLVIPDKMSQEKVFNCRAMGAEVILTRSDVAKGHPEYYQDLAQSIAEDRGAYYVNQFGNPDNPKAHYTTTAPEIFEQMNGNLDAIVVGVGSSGTITGLTQYFQEHAPDVEIVLADPQGSVLSEYVRTGNLEEKGSWLVEGIGEDFIPEICDLSAVKTAYSIPDAESFRVGRELLAKEGLQAGSSTGTLLAAALRYCREQKTPKRVVTFACDTGNRYISKMFNDYWLFDQGFGEREYFKDLRDLIGRPHEEHATVMVGPTDTLATAHNRMRNYGISQLPLLDGDNYLGVVTEADVVREVQSQPDGFMARAESAVNTQFPAVDMKEPLEKLMSRLEIETAVAILDKGRFLGLITRSDILNYLRKQE